VTFLLTRATRAIVCHPTFSASRDGILWYTREHKGSYCHIRERSCSSWAAFGELWTVAGNGGW